MRFFMNWVISPLSVGALMQATNALLPLSLDRFWVITTGAVVAVLWVRFINDPIEKAYP